MASFQTGLGIGLGIAFASLALVRASAEGTGDQPASRSSVYSLSTVIVYNSAVPESKAIAEFYGKARGISDSQILALSCPDREEISRSEFDSTILEPLREAFISNGWWRILRDPATGQKVGSNRMHLLTLIYGMPLKVRNSLPPPTPDLDPDTGKPLPVPQSPGNTNGCSVDSEISLLAVSSYDKAGFVPNPYFKSVSNFYQARPPGMMMVGRIDGPTPEIARNLIREALAAEKRGLWGFAYVDEAQKIKVGDDWLRKSAESIASAGIPVVLDRHRSRFPLNYPMGHAALYFGWYSENVDGPFLNPSFRFLPGAVACHLHSFSAATLRSDSAHWAGPLLAKGAAAVLGNVYEPYLRGTHHFDIFNDRLLKGFSFIECAYMAAPSLSWMGIAVGDPLYRPFEAANRFDRESYGPNGGDSDLKALRLATKRWAADDPDQFHLEAVGAAATLESGRIYEGIALAAANRGDFDNAVLWFEKALQVFRDPSDQVRVQLHRVDLARRLGNKDEAVALLEYLLPRLESLPEAAAVAEILKELRPPLPPSPVAPLPAP